MTTLTSQLPVIRAQGLGKRYRRGVAQTTGLLRDSLGRALKAPFRSMQGPKQENFWALKDVSLEIREGEVLGLIGRNGAGKTTLLKILSRITQPTTGWAEIHGRVGSLLEVGTGFHPELTGRENTFLSGAILGMGKREIAAKFDEIVAFAELEKFIDTPVKHYSSGMYVRLAFAVAAHLEPEILLVDEVLAVGDINFQKKCLGKMGDVARTGRTVVLVSHQLNQIRRLCSRVIWVDDGEIRMDGNAHEVTSAYESAMARGQGLADDKKRELGAKAHFVKWEIENQRGDSPYTLNDLDPVTIVITVDVDQPIKLARHGIALYTHDQQLVFAAGPTELQLEMGQQQLCHKFPSLPLKPGAYNWLVSLYDGVQQLDLWNCVPDLIVATENYQSAYDEWMGLLNLPTTVEVRRGTTSAARVDEGVKFG